MKRGSSSFSELDPRVAQEVVDFLRDWLPASARQTYRAMIEEDPENWSRDPHFAGGIIVQHALRGNGITEKVLGIRDLNDVWPELLRRAVIDPAPGDPRP
jgi:hypothetical protein